MLRSIDKCLPFFKVIKKEAQFRWEENAEQSFQSLKEYLERLPQMISPNIEKLELAYVVISYHAVGMVLLSERYKMTNPHYIT